MPTRSTTDQTEAADPVLLFLRALWHLEHALERASKRMENSMGISGPQLFALRIIGMRPAITAGELAAALHLHPSTVTGIVQRLEARKLVKRVSSSNDRRVVRLHLTPAGSKINRPAPKGSIERAARTTLARVAGPQLKATTAVMGQFADELMKI